jgi:hypothetical protein
VIPLDWRPTRAGGWSVGSFFCVQQERGHSPFPGNGARPRSLYRLPHVRAA